MSAVFVLPPFSRKQRLCVWRSEEGEAVGPQYLPRAAWVSIVAKASWAGKAEL